MIRRWSQLLVASEGQEEVFPSRRPGDSTKLFRILLKEEHEKNTREIHCGWINKISRLCFKFSLGVSDDFPKVFFKKLQMWWHCLTASYFLKWHTPNDQPLIACTRDALSAELLPSNQIKRESARWGTGESTKSGPRKAEPSSSRRRISTQSSQQERSQAFVWCSASLIACLIRTISTYRLPWGRSTSSGSELAKSNNCFPAALGASIWPFSVTHPVSSWLLFVALGCSRLLSAFFLVPVFFSSHLHFSARLLHDFNTRTTCEHMLWRPTVRISAFKNIPLCHLCRWKRGERPRTMLYDWNSQWAFIARNCSSNALRMLLECSSNALRSRGSKKLKIRESPFNSRHDSSQLGSSQLRGSTPCGSF